jgi:dTDP-4-amino-4,6-dideoxygalactose transaminase
VSEETQYIPVYQCLGLLETWSKSPEDYRSVFPFCSEAGQWAFNGRSALHYGLARLALPPGSTILVPNYFQGVEIDTLLYNKYRLEFYRVSRSLDVDLDHVEEMLTPDATALYIIHYFGWPQDLASITAFCKSRGLKLIEDCALSLFSRDGQDWLGSRGELSIYSVYKTLPLPHGGFAVTSGRAPEISFSPPPLIPTVRQYADLVLEDLRHKGRSRVEDVAKTLSRTVRRLLPKKHLYQDVGAGTATWDPQLANYGASSLIAPLMRNVNPTDVIEKRRQNYFRLHNSLSGRFNSPLPELPEYACPLFYPVMVEDKDEIMKRLAERRVGSVNLWWDEHPACPTSLSREVLHLRRHLLELPIHQSLSDEDIDRVAHTFVQAIG